MDSTEKEKEEDWERWVMTTFESVEGHWDKEWRKWKPAPSNPSKADVKGKKKATRQDEEDENPYESQFQFPEDDVKQEDDVDEKMMSSQQLQDWFTQAEKEERGREAEAWDEVVRLENEEFDGGADEERIGVYRSLPNTPTLDSPFYSSAIR
jgi:DNA polymerase zeta